MSELDTLPTAKIVERALEMWSKLTGVTRDQTTFRMGDLDVRNMNEIMDDAQRLDPEGTTAYLLLECFLREYLERKTFTAAQIMKDYEATSRYLKEAEGLFSVVQSERALELASTFRARVVQGVKHYRADREDVLEMIDDADVLPFLRRDALHSLDALHPYQFLQGEAGTGPAQVIEHVYLAWNVNDLLKALRDMPVSGVAVVMLRDASHPDRSYFCFAMRNGGNVILFTDKSRPAYPGQEDVLAGRGGRGAARTFASRKWSNHFPYHLLKTSIDDRGDVVFEAETTPVAAGKSVVPVMPIRELPPHQVIWLTMMLSLINEKFWTKAWRAEALSYTGEMVRSKSLLVEDHSGAALPVAQDYTPITLEDVKLDEVTSEALTAQLADPSQGVNAWLEARYRDAVPEHVLNQWHVDCDTALILPSLKKPEGFRRDRMVGTEVAPGIMAVGGLSKLASWEQPGGYQLQTFSSTEFGTEAELRDDRLFIARTNMARHIQRSADEEFERRKDAVADWYAKATRANTQALLAMIAEESLAKKADPQRGWHPFMTIGQVKGEDFRYTWRTENPIGEFRQKGYKWNCILTGAVSTWRVMFKPRNAADLARLCGCEISDLPDVLQNWVHEKPYTGNHLLNRLDPMDSYVDDPWMKLEVDVNVFLSKRGLSQIEKEFGRSAEAG